MKTLLSLLLVTAFGIQIGSAATSDDKKSTQIKKEIRKELSQLFNERQADRPTLKGAVVALVKIDSAGKGAILEMDSEEIVLQNYVKKQVESRTFQNLQNETIRLVVDFRN
jgi:hypothetical protein